ncbi:MAG: hypothetical protein DRR00_11670 [Candidatus Parabeggiatoa sp. nov. 3]|nr:MAG: hypothetical protein DRR00_11670 [Gammaproteobacteria bacterium]
MRLIYYLLQIFNFANARLECKIYFAYFFGNAPANRFNEVVVVFIIQWWVGVNAIKTKMVGNKKTLPTLQTILMHTSLQRVGSRAPMISKSSQIEWEWWATKRRYPPYKR